MNNRRLITRVLVFISLILFLDACSQVPSPQAPSTPTVRNLEPTIIVTSQPTPSPTPLGGVSAKLGPLPQNCPSGPIPKQVPVFGAAYGSSPVWVTFSGSSSHPTLLWGPTEAAMYHDQYGWIHKFLWLVEARYKGIVTIHGASLRNSNPILLSADSQAATSTPTSLVLNTQDPTIPNRTNQWTEFPGGLSIPEAGCYYLEARWAGGSWRVIFAAGRVSTD